MTESDKRKTLTVELTKLGILSGNTEQIVLNCNAGSICDYKVTTRHK